MNKIVLIVSITIWIEGILNRILMVFEHKLFFNEFDLKSIYYLLSANFSLKESMDLITNDKNKQLFNKINDHLINGDKIDTFFGLYLKDDYAKYFNCFICFEPLALSLALTLDIVNEAKDVHKMYVNNLTYPIITFMITIVGVYLFNLTVFKSMISMMNSFNVNLNYLVIVQIFVNTLSNVFLIVITILLILLLWFKRPKKQVIAYKFINKYLKINVLNSFVSADFCRILKQCHKQGLSTKESMEIIASIKHKPILAYIASYINEQLLQGETIEKALCNQYLDNSLYRFLIVAISTSSLDKMIDSYLMINELKVKDQCKKFSTFFKIFSYLIIAIILIFVYQLLLSPINIIASM